MTATDLALPPALAGLRHGPPEQATAATLRAQDLQQLGDGRWVLVASTYRQPRPPGFVLVRTHSGWLPTDEAMPGLIVSTPYNPGDVVTVRRVIA